METLYRQCVDSVTALWRNPFIAARIKLTAIYGTILSIIVLGFSIILYQSIRFNIFAIAEADLAGVTFRYVFIENALMQVRTQIITMDIVVIAVTTIASYFLARYTLRPIERAMAAQQKFTENASHELRTPLAIMRSEIEVLLRAPQLDTDRVTDTLTSTLEEITSLSNLAEDLLLLARSERAVFPKNAIDVGQVIERVISMLSVLATERDIKLNYEKTAIVIMANEAALTRIILNLVHNALTHTPEGGAVTVATLVTDTTVELRVIDTGRGIPVSVQAHIFDRFYKGGSSTGTGLGLAIVSELAKVHRGRVWLESSSDIGTTFVVSLPRS